VTSVHSSATSAKYSARLVIVRLPLHSLRTTGAVPATPPADEPA
jgi:hypothetical protein